MMSIHLKSVKLKYILKFVFGYFTLSNVLAGCINGHGNKIPTFPYLMHPCQIITCFSIELYRIFEDTTNYSASHNRQYSGVLYNKICRIKYLRSFRLAAAAASQSHKNSDFIKIIFFIGIGIRLKSLINNSVLTHLLKHCRWMRDEYVVVSFN